MRSAIAGCDEAPHTVDIQTGSLQNLAHRLDLESVAVLVDELPQSLNRRSSSAWAKNALATFRISLARRSSLTSRSSSLTRCPLRRRHAFARIGVDLLALDPRQQCLRHAADLGCDGGQFRVCKCVAGRCAVVDAARTHALAMTRMGLAMESSVVGSPMDDGKLPLSVSKVGVIVIITTNEDQLASKTVAPR